MIYFLCLILSLFKEDKIMQNITNLKCSYRIDLNLLPFDNSIDETPFLKTSNVYALLTIYNASCYGFFNWVLWSI